jgi:TonB family protein
MTRERAYGWLGSITLQLLALGALGVSPYTSYDDLPEPHNAIPLRSYVPAVEVIEAPVAPRRAPASAIPKPDIARVLSSFVAPTDVPDWIAEDTGVFLEGVEGVPIGIELGIPSSIPGPQTVEIRETPPAPVRVGGSVTPPRKRHHENPLYPAIAAAARIQGTVTLEATIDEHGNVVDVRVLRSVPLLDQAAIDAVRRWKYEPTLLNGRPVPILMSVTVRFESMKR